MGGDLENVFARVANKGAKKAILDGINCRSNIKKNTINKI